MKLIIAKFTKIIYRNYIQEEILGISFMAMHFKGPIHRIFTVAFYSFFRLGDCPAGLGNWPCIVRTPNRGQKQEKFYCDKNNESPLMRHCHKRDYSRNLFRGQKSLEPRRLPNEGELLCTCSTCVYRRNGLGSNPDSKFYIMNKGPKS